MNTLDDLRSTLENHARQAPDGLGIVAGARAGAARIRRRRRIAAATAAAVAVVAASVPFVTAAHPARPPQPAPAAPSNYRQTWQTTLSLDPAAGYVVTSRGADATRELLLADRPGGAFPDQGGLVSAYDPGTFDPARLLTGDPVTVAGHPAWHVSDYVFARNVANVDGPSLRTPVVGWQDPGGAWVLVHQAARPGTDPRFLLAFAAAVRVGPPRELRSPVTVGPVPAGLPLSHVATYDRDDGQPVLTAGFAPASRGPEDAAQYNGPPAGLRLTVTAFPADSPTWPAERASVVGQATAADTLTVAGHTAWYAAGNGPMAVREGGSALLVDAGSCIVRFEVVDRREVGRDELIGVAAGTRYGSCDSTSGWARPVR